MGKALSKKILITASIVLSGFLFSIWLATSSIGTFLQPNDDLFTKCRSTQVIGGAGTIGGPFTLINQDGETVNDKDVITEPSFVYFGYTFCPDVCPLDSARNAEAVDLLAQKGISVTPIFISIDPKRDTPEAIAEFTKAAVFYKNTAQTLAASCYMKRFSKKMDQGQTRFFLRLFDHRSNWHYLSSNITTGSECHLGSATQN